MLRCTAFIVGWFAAAGYACGGLGIITGENWTASAGDRLCVIAARVQDITRGDMGKDEPHVLELRPMATLAGNFDPSLRPKVSARCYTGLYGTSIVKLPGEGSLVLAVLALRDPTDPNSADWIVSDLCRFMPGESALVEISGIDDPKYVETLKRIQRVRARAIAAATTNPATERP